jgi:hypothetical protein
VVTVAPNFALLEMSHPEVASLVAAMLQARDAVERRSWAHPQEPTAEEWWADVLADPRARKRERRADLAVKQAFYRLADEKRETITCRVQQVRLAGGIFARPPDRLSWCGLRDAQPAQPSPRTELQQARLPLGSLRGVLCRANRGRAVARQYHEDAAAAHRTRARHPVLHRNWRQPCRCWHHRARNAVHGHQGIRSASPEARRISICTLRPSAQPNSCSPRRNAARNLCPVELSSDIGMSTPIRRIGWRCCAHDAFGHAAAPPSSVMNPRRFMASPSFDHLVGAGEQTIRHGKTERLGGLEVDD